MFSERQNFSKKASNAAIYLGVSCDRTEKKIFLWQPIMTQWDTRAVGRKFVNRIRKLPS